jgi:hypothetical protein
LSALEGGIMMCKVTLDPAPMRNSVNLMLRQFKELKVPEGRGRKTYPGARKASMKH